MRFCLLFFALCLQLMPLNAADLHLRNDASKRSTDHILEWEITGAKTEWKHFDVQKCPRLQITDPSGVVTIRPAFLYLEHRNNPDDTLDSGISSIGGETLRIRHQARNPGHHSIELFDPQGKSILKDKLHIDRGKRPIGPIKRSPINRHLLSYADGQTFIPIGCNIAWANGPNRLQRIKSYLNAFAKHGGNHFRLWMCSWSCQIESEHPDVYRLDHAFLLDEILKTARELSLHVTIVLDNHHDLVHGHAMPYGSSATERIANFLDPKLHPQYQRRLHYILARYGCDDQILAWELFNELDEALYNQTLPDPKKDMQAICATWVPAAATYLKSIDQDQRLVTSSLSWQTWSEVEGAHELDLIQIHEYIPVLKDVHPLQYDGLLPMQTHLPRIKKYKRPFRFSEVGHQGTNEHNPGNDHDPSGILLRQQAWAGFLLGGYGSGMAWWWDVYIDEQGLWQVYQPMQDIIAKLNWLDSGLKPIPVNTGSSLRVMGWQSTDQALIWPQIRDNTWHALTIKELAPVAYKRQGFVLKGFLPNRAFKLSWYSMEDGHKHSSTQLKSSPDGKLQVICPKGQMMMVAVIGLSQE